MCVFGGQRVLHGLRVLRVSSERYINEASGTAPQTEEREDERADDVCGTKKATGESFLQENAMIFGSRNER